jgi:hypothetical protein
VTGATVTIESGFQPAEDVLALPAPVGNITGSYSSATGVLTLSGSDTGANYQAALRSVTYADTATVPNTSPRSITFGLACARERGAGEGANTWLRHGHLLNGVRWS